MPFERQPRKPRNDRSAQDERDPLLYACGLRPSKSGKALTGVIWLLREEGGRLLGEILIERIKAAMDGGPGISVIVFESNRGKHPYGLSIGSIPPLSQEQREKRPEASRAGGPWSQREEATEAQEEDPPAEPIPLPPRSGGWSGGGTVRRVAPRR